ncbi:MAG: hypothetical protein JW869_04605, partial [Candidatus Omnitrophica bacterium]|nr:hypothetical protein [Candidatus Omnitrophota bacterium]
MDIQEQIADLIKTVIKRSQWAGVFEDVSFFGLDIPNNRVFGDFSSNVAMALGRKTKEPAQEIAVQIRQGLESELRKSVLAEKIEKIEVKTPGFINFFLSASYLYDVLSEICKRRD